MKEDFLHFIWQYNYFDQSKLKSTAGHDIQIISNGIDKPITNRKKVRIPCIELYNRVESSVLLRYTDLIIQKSWIACADSIHTIDQEKTMLWLTSIAVERMEKKAALIHKEHQSLNLHWDQTFLLQLCKAFGLKVNKEAFASLATSFPNGVIKKYAHNIEQLEALLFGQAGMLSARWTDEYALNLANEYRFLKHKHNLKEIPLTYWKFGRLRPANFPTIRIAQLAQLLNKKQNLFSQILETKVHELIHLFDDIGTSPYWDNHYRFDKESKSKHKKLGKDRIHLIFINCICPLLFSYGAHRQNQDYIDKAISILEILPPETNNIVNKWDALSISARHAIDSQALIHLKKTYCDQYKCVSCQIGHQLLMSRKETT